MTVPEVCEGSQPLGLSSREMIDRLQDALITATANIAHVSTVDHYCLDGRITFPVKRGASPAALRGVFAEIESALGRQITDVELHILVSRVGRQDA